MTPARIDPIVRLLTERRLRRGWSRARTAAILGVHQSTLSAWENGTREPNLATLRRWAELFGLDDITAIAPGGIPVWATVADDDEGVVA